MTDDRIRARDGFSLIEILLVCMVISVLVSLILPALESGRESARRIQCVNNLRQISLALQNYETQIGVLPPGVVNPTGPVNNQPDDMHISWVVQILPYLEQYGVWEVIDTRFSVYDPENLTSGRTRITSLLCPADPLWNGNHPRGLSTYAGSHHDVEAPIDVDNRGVLFLNSSITHDDLVDGSSHTIFLGEKILEPADLGWMSGTRAMLRNTGTSLRERGLLQSTPGKAEVLGVGGFGSYHPNGANFAFGDGSVRFINATIDPRVYQYLANRADGVMLEEGEY